jgi:hypothetical protein
MSSTQAAARRAVNITPTERVGRIVIGVLAMIAAITFLTGAGTILAVILEVLVFAAGADLVVTGAIGHCPLYQKLGYVPRSLRGES